MKLERLEARRVPHFALRRIRPKVLGGDLASSTTESPLEKDGVQWPWGWAATLGRQN